MKRISLLVGLCLALLVVDTAEARRRIFGRRRGSYNYSNYSYNTHSSGSWGSTPQAVAEAKVALLASRGYGFHPGGGYGGANAEGWGMGYSPGAAQCSACFYGYRSLAASAQAQSNNGTWFSINLYW